jgi:sugar phosphate permease
MLAGESIYMLPYMRKTFQTSMEQVFALSGTEVGLLNGMFGVLALACYFPGGWVADRFPVRHLLGFSLGATSLGGFAMLTLPGFWGLMAIHAYWGVTSILTFWAALIKATRAWGGTRAQGTGFGLLDGGRGATAALLATLATGAFALAGAPEAGLLNVLLVYSSACALAGVLTWRLVPPDEQLGIAARGEAEPAGVEHGGGLLQRLRATLRHPEVLLIAAIILAGYMLYIGSFEFPAYAERAYGQSKTFGATLGTFRDWLRPVAAISAGLLADRVPAAAVVAGTFGLMLLAFGSLALLPPAAAPMAVLWAQVAVAGGAGFALRGIYYALLQTSHVPFALTGTAVGVVSVIGYTPDIFGHFLAGWFTGHYSGALGYRYYFALLAGVAALGGLVSLVLWVRNRRGAMRA